MHLKLLLEHKVQAVGGSSSPAKIVIGYKIEITQAIMLSQLN